jgi:glycosyltransferase involved in cell wall biosynthesis
MSGAPEVSVVVPTRNRWALLERTMASALAQQDVALELLVVDDGSTDETAARLAELVDPRVRVLRLDRGGGPARARNAGLAIARGTWVAFLDDDDLWAPCKLRSQLDAAALEGATYAYGAAAIFDHDGGVREVIAAPDPGTVRREVLSRNVIPGGCSNLIARTEAVRAVGGFDERLWTLADWDLWIRVAQTGPGAACPDILVGYRRHPGSMVLRGAADAVAELTLLMAKHRELARSVGARLRSSATYRYFARAHRRAGRMRHAARLYLAAARSDHRPGDLLRAIVVLLGPVGSWLSGVRRGTPSEPVVPPPWLTRYL